MAIQEMDLETLHRAGKRNSNADALSRCPLPHTANKNTSVEGVIAAVNLEADDSLSTLQRGDPDLAPNIESGVLPLDDRLAKRLALRIPVCDTRPGVVSC